METPEQPNTESKTRPARRPLFMRLFGLRRRPGKWVPIGLTAWGIFLTVVVLLVVGGAGFAEYSLHPEFCRSCHIMEPYFQAWHRSSHSGIPCQDCHFEPGWRNTLKGKFQASAQVAKYLTRTYGTKPHAEIADVSCLRSGCHDRRLLDGKVQWDVLASNNETITISFDHRPHLTSLRRGKQLKCVSCHSQIVQGEHLTVTLDTCFVCHFKGLKHGRENEVLGGCRSCHDAPTKVIQMELGPFNHHDYVDRGVSCENCHSDAVKGDGEVPRQVCGYCHNKLDHLERYHETELIHRNHVTEHKVECLSCHVQIVHGLKVADRKETGMCAACHEGSHGGPAALYNGVGGRGVPDMPSPMSRTQVDCIACHRHESAAADVAEVIGQTFTAVDDACVYCHGEKYEGVLDEWRARINTIVTAAESEYDRASGLVERPDFPEANRATARALLDDAGHNVRLVKLGHGVHNVNYSAALLNAASEFCRRVEDMAHASDQPAERTQTQEEPEPSGAASSAGEHES